VRKEKKKWKKKGMRSEDGEGKMKRRIGKEGGRKEKEEERKGERTIEEKKEVR
jgi:hypothetical protein